MPSLATTAAYINGFPGLPSFADFAGCQAFVGSKGLWLWAFRSQDVGLLFMIICQKDKRMSGVCLFLVRLWYVRRHIAQRLAPPPLSSSLLVLRHTSLAPPSIALPSRPPSSCCCAPHTFALRSALRLPSHRRSLAVPSACGARPPFPLRERRRAPPRTQPPPPSQVRVVCE